MAASSAAPTVRPAYAPALGRGAWPWLLLAAIAGAASIVVSLAPWPAAWKTGAGDLLQLAAGLGGAWLCLAAAQRRSGALRSGWRLLGLASAMFVAGQVVWTWYEVVLGREVPFPGLSDVGYYALYPFAVAGLLVLSPLAGSRRLARGALLLDGMLSVLAVYALAWPAVLHDAFHASPTAWEAYLTIGYPLADILLLGLAGGILMRSRPAWQSGLGLAYGAFLLVLVGDLGWTTGIFSHTYATGQLADTGWIVGFLVLGAGSRASQPIPGQSVPGLYNVRVGHAIPLTAITITGLAVMLAIDREAIDTPWSVVVATLVGLAFLRQWLAASEWREHQVAREAAESQYRDLFDHAAVGIVQSDAQGRFQMANDAFARMMGYPDAPALRAAGVTAAALCPPPEVAGPAAERLGRGETIQVPLETVRADGSSVWMDALMRPVRTEGGRATLVEAFLTDVTAERRLAHALERTRRTLRVTSMCNQALVRATDEHALMQEICELLVGPGSYRMAWIGAAEDTPGRQVRPLAKAGHEEGYLAAAAITWSADDARGRGPVGRALRTGEVQDVRDIAKDPSMEPWRAEALARGYASCCALPLRAPRLNAMLCVYSAEAEAFGPEELALLRELSGDLAFGIKTIREREAQAAADVERRALQARYASLVENAAEGIFLNKPDGTILFANQAAADILDYPSVTEFLRSIPSATSLYVDPAEREDFLRHVRSGTRSPFEVRLRRRDGSPIWVAIRARLVTQPDGSMLLQGLMEDLSERRKAEAALRESEARLRQSQAVSHVGSWDFDVVHDKAWWSDEMHRLFGTDPAKFQPTYAASLTLMHPEDRASVDSAFRRALAAGTAYDCEHRVVRPDGTVRILREHGQPFVDAAGRATRVVGTAQDITDARKAEEAAQAFARQQAQVERLEEMNRMRAEFLNTAAHDLRTPLTPLRLSIGTLRLRAASDPAQSATLQVMERNLARFQLLIDDMLDAARLQAGRLKLKREVVALAPLVEDAAASFAEPARQGGLEFAVEPVPDLLVDVDPLKAMQVLMNLVSNAVKYTPKGGHVRITVAAHDGEAVVAVQDDGLGLSPEQLAALFRPFVRAHEGVAGIAPGTGLGLYISRGIMEQHGGRVWGESAGPGRGSTFYVAFPRGSRASGIPGPAAQGQDEAVAA